MLQQINTQRDLALKVDKQTNIKLQWIIRKGEIPLKWTHRDKSRKAHVMLLYAFTL